MIKKTLTNQKLKNHDTLFMLQHFLIVINNHIKKLNKLLIVTNKRNFYIKKLNKHICYLSLNQFFVDLLNKSLVHSYSLLVLSC